MKENTTINAMLDSDIPIGDITDAEVKQMSYAIKYFEFWSGGYEATDIRQERLTALRTRLQAMENKEYAILKEKAEQKEKARKEAAQAARLAKFNEAKRTGKPVLLERWQEECDDPYEQCDIDDVYEYAMPDGTTKTIREHNW